MNDLILTDQEKHIILTLRQDDIERKKAQENLVHHLGIAAKYAAWLKENSFNFNSSYTMFLNDFGYNSIDDNENTSLLYKIVMKIIDNTRNI